MEGSDGYTFPEVKEKSITEWRASINQGTEVGKSKLTDLAEVEKAGQSRAGGSLQVHKTL